MTSLHELTRPPEPPRTLRPSRRATARKRGPHDAGYLLGPDTVEDFEQIGLADDEAERSDEEETGLSGTDLAPTSTSDNEDASFRVPAAKLILEDWEDRIAWEQPKRTRPLSSLQRDSEESKTLSEDWTSAILWDSPANYWKATAIPSPHLPTTFSLDLDLLPPNPYNVSNDKFYEVHEKKGMRRKGATQAVLQHSTPALLLEHPFYRTSVTVEKIRHFHRPLFRRPAEDIFLNPLKPAKKRRTEGGGPPKTLKELTLGDRNPFVLFEYSEEHPPFLSNIGMGALIQNYYRKRDPRDTHLAEFPDGEPQVLDAEHGASVEDGTLPFTIANVEPGTSLQALTTNMFRAPIFAHSTNHSDFLIIRHQHVYLERNHQVTEKLYYARPIETVYVVGQEIPRMEIPKPSSRRLGNIIKARMMAQAYRMIKESGNRGELDLAKIYKEYPEFVQLHIRQKLRELAHFSRKSSHTSMWRLAPGATLPSEAWIQKQVTPDDICMVQGMLAAAQRLSDSGRQIMDLMGDEGGEDVDVMRDMEEDLAPWNITRNFMHSLVGKCQLRVHGEGEPTGRGEAINMMRQPKDTPFIKEDDARRGRSGDKLSATEQRQLYRKEIQRIFNQQNRTLASKEEVPDASRQEEYVQSPYTDLNAGRKVSTHIPRAASPAFSPPYAPRATSPGPMSPPGSPEPSLYSSAYSDEEEVRSVAESSISHAQGVARNLVIIRKEKSPNGSIITSFEMIDDPRVAKEYLKARRRIDSKGNDDKQREVATDEQLLILQRKSSRRNMICSTCGQFGHMRSSLKCPMRQAKNQPGQFTGQGMPLGGQPVQNPQYQAFAAPVPSPAPAPVPFSMPQETAGSGGSGLKLVLKAGTAPKRKYDAMSP